MNSRPWKEVQDVLASLKLTSITADDLAAGDLRRVRKSVTGRLSVNAGKHEEAGVRFVSSIPFRSRTTF